MEKGIVMERETENFAEALQEVTEEEITKRSLAQTAAKLEHQRLIEANAAEYVNEHLQEFIDELRKNAELSAHQGITMARISRRDSPENREGLYQTMREVRDYYRREGFLVGMDSGDNGRMIPKGNHDYEWEDATLCWAQVTIDWSKR